MKTIQTSEYKFYSMIYNITIVRADDKTVLIKLEK